MSEKPQRDLYVQVGEINTRYWASGDEGNAVLLLHGIGDYVEVWEQNIDVLGEQHHVFALDLVGFGRTDKPDASYSLAYFGQFVHDFLETQNIERATMIGNSLGGAVAMQFAVQYPSQLDKLVLVAAAGLGKEVALLLRMLTLPLVGELLTRPSRKGSADFLTEMYYDPSLVTEEIIDLDYELWTLPGTQRAFLRTLRSSVGFFGIRDQVRLPVLQRLFGIPTKTLIVWGEQDTILPVAQAHTGAEYFSDAQVHVFDRCGHAPQFERPEAFNRLVLDFLAS